MTSSRLFSPPRRRPWSRFPRPQLSRSRHANFWPGTKGSAPAARGGRARLSNAARPAHTPLAGSARVAGGSPPLSSPATAAAPPGQPPWKPGSARRGLQGRRTGAGPAGSPAGRGGGGGKDWKPRRQGRGFLGLGPGTPAHPSPPLAHSSTPAGVVVSPPARVRGEEQSWSRRTNLLTKESPALISLARPLRPRFFPTPGVRAQHKGEPRRGAPASPTASRLWLGPLGAPSAGRDLRARVGGLHYSRLQLCHTVLVFFQCHLWR